MSACCGVYVDVRGQLWGATSIHSWVVGTELKFLGLHEKHFTCRVISLTHVFLFLFCFFFLTVILPFFFKKKTF